MSMTGGRPAAIHSTFNSVIRRIAPTADTGSVRDGWTNSCCSLTITRNSFSSPVTLLRPSVSSTLQITNRLFRYASPYLWNQLPYAAFTLRCIASCMQDAFIALHPACRMHGVNTPYASCNNTPYYAVLRRMHPAMHTPHASRNAGVDEICCFNTITACGGRWDGQTDRHIAIAFSALCIITEDRTINKAASVGGRGNSTGLRCLTPEIYCGRVNFNHPVNENSDP